MARSIFGVQDPKWHPLRAAPLSIKTAAIPLLTSLIEKMAETQTAMITKLEAALAQLDQLKVAEPADGKEGA